LQGDVVGYRAWSIEFLGAIQQTEHPESAITPSNVLGRLPQEAMRIFTRHKVIRLYLKLDPHTAKGEVRYPPCCAWMFLQLRLDSRVSSDELFELVLELPF
jgi:hypothetical protein